MITPAFVGSALVPTAFRALTANVYALPLGRPEISCVVAVELYVIDGWTRDPWYGVTTYPVIGEPPSSFGALPGDFRDRAVVGDRARRGR